LRQDLDILCLGLVPQEGGQNSGQTDQLEEENEEGTCKSESEHQLQVFARANNNRRRLNKFNKKKNILWRKPSLEPRPVRPDRKDTSSPTAFSLPEG
jgi:hypothetical protein